MRARLVPNVFCTNGFISFYDYDLVADHCDPDHNDLGLGFWKWKIAMTLEEDLERSQSSWENVRIFQSRIGRWRMHCEARQSEMAKVWHSCQIYIRTIHFVNHGECSLYVIDSTLTGSWLWIIASSKGSRVDRAWTFASCESIRILRVG